VFDPLIRAGWRICSLRRDSERAALGQAVAGRIGVTAKCLDPTLADACRPQSPGLGFGNGERHGRQLAKASQGARIGLRSQRSWVRPPQALLLGR